MKTSTSVRFTVAIVEQVLLGVSSYAVSWFALRTLGVSQFSIYATAWAMAWGGFAFISEFLITPNRVAAAQRNHGQALLGLSLFGITVGAAILPFSALLNSNYSIFLASASLVFSTLGFYALRAFHQFLKNTKLGLSQCFVYFVSTLALLLVLESSKIGSNGALLIAAASAALLAPTVVFFPFSFFKINPFGQVGKAMHIATKLGLGFGVSTLIRVLTYSIAFLACLGFLRGEFSLATYAAAMVLISPSQIFSGAAAWVALPTLASSVTFGNFRAVLFRQLFLYIIGGAVLIIGLLVVWPWWVQESIAIDAIRRSVQSDTFLIASIMFWTVMSGLSSNALQTLKAQKAHVLTTTVAGLAGLGVLVIGSPVLLAAQVPYIIFTVFGIAFAFIKWSRVKSEISEKR